MRTCKQIIVGVTLLASLSGFGLTEVVDGVRWTYTVNNGVASVGGGSDTSTAVPKSTSGAITIPSMLGGYLVAGIDNGAFYGCNQLMNVAMHSSITNIEANAFGYCSKLTSVTIPDAVMSIEGATFVGCSGLMNITIPNSVTNIGVYAFYGCSRLTSVVIPDSVAKIGDEAFSGCNSMTSVTIGKGVTRIGERAFYNCKALTCVYISDIAAWCQISFCDTDVSDNPLYYAHNLYVDGQLLKDLTIPASVNKIGDKAFYNCTNLLSVAIPNSVTSIGWDAFSGCSGLSSIAIPNSVTNIGSSAFYGCSGLTSIEMPDSVTSIGSSAFYGCSGLTSIEIPDSVTSIGWDAFRGCTGLENIAIPNSVTSIGRDAFGGCRKLRSVTIPQYVCTNQLSSILSSSYQNLTNVVVSDGVTCIGAKLFYDCYNLKSITIPSSVTRIGNNAFSGCDELTSVYIDDISALCQMQISLGGYPFANLYATNNLYVNGILQKNVTIPNSVTNIGEYAFYGCSGLTSVTIPDSVTRIGSSAFSGCSGLRSVTIPDSVTSIGSAAFRRCGGLTSVTISDRVTSIKNQTFEDCSDLTSIEIPASVTSIGYNAFKGCVALKSAMVTQCVCTNGLSTVFPSSYQILTHVVIADDVTSIGDEAFGGCTGLVSVLIGDSVTSVGASAFAGCGGLTSMALPDSVASIGDGAFSGCSGLEKISLPFVGARRGNSGSSDALFGYIFGMSPYEGGDSTVQYYSASLHDAFYIPSKLRQVTITDETSFGYGAFSYCSGLTNITFGSSVTSIGPAAFRSCSGLTSVRIPKLVVSIGNQAFDGCSKLMGVYIDDVASWCKISFGNYYSNPLVYANKLYVDDVLVTDLVIPSSTTRIGSFAFCKCSSLTSVTIPDSVVDIGSYAFRNCSGLTTIIMPDSVASIGSSAFEYCSKLANVYIADLAAWCDIRFGGISSNPLSCAKKFYVEGVLVTDLTIPDSVTSIGSYSFYNCSGLTSITVPNSVTNIGSYAFGSCSGLTNLLLKGDAPSVGGRAFSGVANGCCAYVRRYSSGWGVDIPGMWQSMLIDYVRRNVTFDANDGSCIVTNICVADGGEIGELPTPTRWGYAFKGWWTAQDGGEEVTGATIIENDKTLYAHWEQYVVDVPVVVPSDGSVFYGDSCEVTITCATDGAMIYYSDNEVLPEIEDGYLYNAPFVISDTTVIKAVAVFEGVKSDCVTVTITKEDKSLNAVLDAPDAVTIVSDPAVAWQPVVDEAAKIGGSSARSGAIGDRASTWLSATVEGAGAMTFWCKTSCEHDEDNMFAWDRLMIYTNGVEIAEWRMDGETDWTERTLSFEGGVNTVKWVYYKDRTGADGEDCAWVDAVTWTPSEAADPIPAVAVDADAATVNAAVDGAGFVDAAVKVTIGGSATEYNAFKTWADGVKGTAGDALAGEAAVVANAHAAAAYLLGAERLFENEPTVEIGELAIVDGESAGTTAMTVAVTVKDGESAVAVDAAKVAAMFEATGDLGDWTGAAKLTPMVTNSGTDASGKMTFVVIPGDGTAAKAFFRIRK